MSTTRQSLQTRLLHILKRFPDRKLLILGDAIADKFVYGSISRVSREAPVFILKHEHTETVPGGAANCAVNLAALGATVLLVSVTGNDDAGHELREKLKASGVGLEGMHISETSETTTKVRILAGQTHSTRQQVIRIDYEADPVTDQTLRQSINNFLESMISTCDAVILSDYNYGMVDDAAIEVVRAASRAKSIPVLVDSRFSLSKFTGFSSATPNEEELEHLLGQRVSSTEELEIAAMKLKEQINHRALLVTRGGEGMMLLEGKALPLHIKAVGGRQPVDVTGAGDTVIATFALALASGASYADAAHLANYAGGLVVMKRGTASVTVAELEQSILNSDLA